MSMLKTLMILAAAAMLMELAISTNFTVGGPTGGWDTTTNLQAWASSQAFSVGDNLLFQYTPNHNVLEVSKADYYSCQSSNPIQIYSDGTTPIALVSPGNRYFICGITGHCSQGMKVEIDTSATTAPPTPTPPVIPPASSPPAETPITQPPANGGPTPSPIVPPTGSPANFPSRSVFSSPPPFSSDAGVMSVSTTGFAFVMLALLFL